jgi:hypothetical protein
MKTAIDIEADCTIIQAADVVHHYTETDVLKIPLEPDLTIEIDLREYAMPDREILLKEAERLNYK